MPKRDSSPNVAMSVGRRNSAAGRGCLILFFGIFAAAGGGMLWWMLLRPLWGVANAQFWTETPCTIVSSEVEVHDGDDGDTYSIEIRYDYTFGGQSYRGERYHFMHGMASSGREGKQAVVDRYPVGLETTCFVDPSDPSQSVINRNFTTDMLWGLFSLPFLAVGVGGLLFGTGVVKFRKPPADGIGTGQAPLALGAGASDDDGEENTDDWSDGFEPDAEGPLTLKPRYSPLGKFLGITCIALFWNGITGVFVYHAAKSHLDGRPEWCLTFFILPFVAVGMLMIWGIFHSFLALFIPRPTLTVDRARLPLGGATRITWKFSGNAHVIRQLKVTLRGEEVATYRRGTDTYTDKHTFHKDVVFETHDPLEIPEGSAEIRIPDDTMHSFDSGNNKVVWEIHLDGEIPLRPDIDAEFPITVTPHEQYQRRNH